MVMPKCPYGCILETTHQHRAFGLVLRVQPNYYGDAWDVFFLDKHGEWIEGNDYVNIG